MTSILVVFGATGQQGGSLIEYVLADPILSKRFKLRAVTRNVSSSRARDLEHKGVEIVQADADDADTLKSALKNVHTVFAVTVTEYGDPDLKTREMKPGKAIADAAVEAGAQYLIFSSLTHASNITGGKLKNMAHFDGRRSFMQNFHGAMGPHPVGDRTYALINFVSPNTQLPLIDTVDDTGKYVGAILADPDKYEGKVLTAATGLWSLQEVVDEMSRMSSKTVTYKQLPQPVFAGSLLPLAAPYLVDMMLWIQDYGYYGPTTKENVELTVKQARGKLTTLEEYLDKHPLPLV